MRLVHAAPAWWRAVRAAGARSCGQEWRRPATPIRAGLLRHGRGAWRHRRTAIGTVWSVCLIGWTGSVLLPDGTGSPAATGGASPASAASAAAPGQRPSPPGPRAPQLEDDRATVAGLQADLEAALALRTAHTRQLAGVPRLLEGRPNPIYQRRAIQLDQQDALVAALRLRIAALTEHAADRERHLHGPARRVAGRATSSGRPGGGVPSGSAHQSPAATGPSGSSGAAAGVPRLVVLCGVLPLAAAAGAALAAWRGRHDGIVDHPGQLRQRAQLPVLCTITLPAWPGQAERERVNRKRTALAGLGLLGLFASLVAAERAGALAAARRALLASWPG